MRPPAKKSFMEATNHPTNVKSYNFQADVGPCPGSYPDMYQKPVIMLRFSYRIDQVCIEKNIDLEF